LLCGRGADMHKTECIDGQTPLKAAIMSENPEPLSMVELLVNLGADVNYTRKNWQQTALGEAVTSCVITPWRKECLMPVIEFLLEHGADINKKPRCAKSVTEWAKEYNDTELLELLEYHRKSTFANYSL
jgi:hypothetical protein